MNKIDIILSWDGIMKSSQFSSACADTIRHGVISDGRHEWKGIVCSPFYEEETAPEDKRWSICSYESSEDYFGWMNAIKDSSADWVLLTYPGVAVHIDSLVNSLELISNPEDPICYCAAMNYDVEDEICRMLEGGNGKLEIGDIIAHEWGSLIISRGAVKRFMENRDLINSLTSRSGSPLRFDHISVLPRVAGKVPLTVLKTMSPNRSSESFRGINRTGKYSLIHYVGDWMDEGGWHDYLRARLFASSMDKLEDGEFSTPLSMPEIRSDVILLMSEPGNTDRIKWLQKSCQQHVRPVPSIVVMLQESANGRYYGKDYEKTVDFCAATRTGVIRMRQDKKWSNDALLAKGCSYLVGKNAKRIFATSGDCYMLNDPFKIIGDKKGIVYFTNGPAPVLDTFGLVVDKDGANSLCDQIEMWGDHSAAVTAAKIDINILENIKIMRKEESFWKTMTKDNVFKMAREGRLVAATGEMSCRHLSN